MSNKIAKIYIFIFLREIESKMGTWQNWLLQAAIFAHSCLVGWLVIGDGGIKVRPS